MAPATVAGSSVSIGYHHSDEEKFCSDLQGSKKAEKCQNGPLKTLQDFPTYRLNCLRRANAYATRRNTALQAFIGGETRSPGCSSNGGFWYGNVENTLSFNGD